MRRLHFVLMAIPVLMFLGSCNREDGGIEDNFDRALILKNVTDNIIIPVYNDYVAKTASLNTAIGIFIQAGDLSSLESAKLAWVDAKTSWKKAEAFNFGPVDDLSYETAIDLWPTSVFGIENELGNYDGTDVNLDGIGSDKKGLPAIEYLLFHAEEEVVLQEFVQENRVKYLQALSQVLESQANEILNLWETTYADFFIENTGNDVGSGATLLANEMIFLVEKIKNFKVAVPAGITTGGDPLPEKVEAFYATNSLQLLLINLEIIEEIFKGGEGNGFDDYLDALELDIDDEKLSDEIVDQIADCRATALLINGTLQETIFSHPEIVEELFINLQALTVLMKTDMMSRLGLIVTFSDNDGD